MPWGALHELWAAVDAAAALVFTVAVLVAGVLHGVAAMCERRCSSCEAPSLGDCQACVHDQHVRARALRGLPRDDDKRDERDERDEEVQRRGCRDNSKGWRTRVLPRLGLHPQQ